MGMSREGREGGRESGLGRGTLLQHPKYPSKTACLTTAELPSGWAPVATSTPQHQPLCVSPGSEPGTWDPGLGELRDVTVTVLESVLCPELSQEQGQPRGDDATPSSLAFRVPLYWLASYSRSGRNVCQGP